MNIVGLGFAARGAGHFYQARNQFHQALQTEIGAQNLVRLYTIIPGIALLLSSLGEPERAVELYALASTNPYVANSCWFEDVVGKHIAKVAESLPSKVVAAARERGRTRDLWETAEELLAEFEGEAHIE